MENPVEGIRVPVNMDSVLGDTSGNTLFSRSVTCGKRVSFYYIYTRFETRAQYAKSVKCVVKQFTTCLSYIYIYRYILLKGLKYCNHSNFQVFEKEC